MLSLTKTSLVFLRPPLIYGPNDLGNTYGPSGFCSTALKGDPIALWGDGTELREFIHINDLCRIIELLIDHPFSGPLNVVSGRQSSFSEIVELLSKSTTPPNILSRPRSKQKADNAFVPTLIKSLLPETFSFTPLAEGVEQLMKRATP
jgi:UDP-glucose 4-epimerase